VDNLYIIIIVDNLYIIEVDNLYIIVQTSPASFDGRRLHPIPIK
jgi:hypothetical protein